MSKLGSFAGGIVFLIVAAISLYRLLFWFPITIGEQRVGQVASFFVFVVCGALCAVLFRQGIVSDRR
ncbi:MAG: hypothetical protein ACJ8EH_12290 [Sphingomicrobium sp.]|jgi:hypothetical protein